MFFRLFSFAFGIGSLNKSSPLWIIWCRGIGVAKETLLLFHHSIFFFHHLTLLLLKAREAKGNSSYYQLFLHPTQSIRFFGPESLDEFLSIRTSLLIFFFELWFRSAACSRRLKRLPDAGFVSFIHPGRVTIMDSANVDAGTVLKYSYNGEADGESFLIFFALWLGPAASQHRRRFHFYLLSREANNTLTCRLTIGWTPQWRVSLDQVPSQVISDQPRSTRPANLLGVCLNKRFLFFATHFKREGVFFVSLDAIGGGSYYAHRHRQDGRFITSHLTKKTEVEKLDWWNGWPYFFSVNKSRFHTRNSQNEWSECNEFFSAFLCLLLLDIHLLEAVLNEGSV